MRRATLAALHSGGGRGDGGGGDGGGDGDGKCKPNFSTVKSGTFYATGYTDDLVNLQNAGGASIASDTVFSSDEENETLVPVKMRDDGQGNIMLVTTKDEVEVILDANVGSVDYSTGQVCIGPIAIAQTPSGEEQLPISVMPYGGSIEIPPGVDPTLFNPKVNPIDYTINKIPVPNFDPNNHKVQLGSDPVSRFADF